MGIEDCVFDNFQKRGIGKTLRMGEACIYCRWVRLDVEVPVTVLTPAFPRLWGFH